ncbi:Schlafen family member 11 [Microtus ochrogaster]|uniref:Schlafen family member 11 n=1 Tax=Microtus ochrogaster TaxID=79684 RepID=A0A8J6G9W6_MICOH|nr:Schlafen family member 11 [Microtus ochrogaster]
MELCSEHERYEQLLQTELGSLRQGKLIISESLALSLGLQKKQEVILDVLHISQDSLLTLHSFVRGEEELEGDSSVLRDLGAKLKNDCKQTALTLKQKLVNLGGYTGKIVTREKNASVLRCSVAKSPTVPELSPCPSFKTFTK